jgi:outer membrane protein
MNLIRKYFITILFLALVTNSFSQDNKEILKLSLSEAQDFAIKNNRSVQSAKIDVSSARKKVWENLATGLPQLNVSANYLHQFVVPQISFGPYLDVNSLPDGYLTREDFNNAYLNSPPIALGVRNNTTIDMTLSQLIFSGQYLIGLQATKVVSQVTEKGLFKTEQQTRETVAGTYYLLLVLGENLKLLNTSYNTVNQTYKDLSMMNQEGLNEETDVDQIKINRSNIQTLMASMESQKEISMKLLKYQLGLDFSANVELTDSLSGIILQGNLQYLSPQEFDVNKSVDYQMASAQEQISELLFKAQKAQYLPTISAFYRHEEQTNQPSFNFAVKDVVGATLNIPIVTSGVRSSKVSQARFDLQKSALAKEDARQGLIMEYEKASSNYQTAYSNYVTNKESMNLSKTIYDRTVIKYKEGVSTSFELTQNQNQFLNTESNYYNSVLALLNAKAELDRILSNSSK